MNLDNWLHPIGIHDSICYAVTGLTMAQGVGGVWHLIHCVRQPSSHFLLRRSRVVVSVLYLAVAALALAAVLVHHKALETTTPAVRVRFALLITTLLTSVVKSVLAFVPLCSPLIAFHSVSSCCGWGLLFLTSFYPDLTACLMASLHLCVLLAVLALEGDYASSRTPYSSHHPLTRTNPTAAITLSWLDPLITLGASGPVSSHELWNVDDQLSVRHALQKSLHFRKGLLATLVSRFPTLALKGAVLSAIDLTSTFAQPFLLQSLLVQRNYACLAAMFTVGIVGGFSSAHSTYSMRRLGLQLRPLLTSIISSRSLRDQQAEMTSTPEISVLLESDLPRLHEFIEASNLLWLVPSQLAISMGALCFLLGWKSVALGSALAVIAFPMFAKLSSLVSKQFQKVMIASDARVAEVTQTMKQAKQVKLHAWTNHFEKRISERRDQELKAFQRVAVCNTFMMLIVSILPTAFGFTIFAAHAILTGERFSVEIVFPVLAFLFNISRAVSMLPQIVMSFQAARISWRRVQSSMATSHTDTQSVRTVRNASDTAPRVTMRAVTLGTSESNVLAEPLLKDCNFDASPGSLNAIIGGVGSGKTTLLRAIVQDFRPSAGSIHVDGQVAFSTQAPQIIRGTIRDNILLGLPLEEIFYRRVLNAVALTHDLARLPKGDATFLGGAGVGLSGGQKSRVCLARAIYSKRNVVILDDPLAAVDAQVQSHLIREVLGPEGILRHTTRIVVTSSPRLLMYADRVYKIKAGTIVLSSPSEHTPPNLHHQDFVAKQEKRPQKQTAVENTDSEPFYGTLENEHGVLMPTAAELADSLGEETPLLRRKRSTDDSTLLATSYSKTSSQGGAYSRYLNAAAPGGWPVVIVLAAVWKVCDVVGIWALRNASDQATMSAQLHSLFVYLLFGCLGSLCVVSFILCAWFLCVIPASRHIHRGLTSGVLQSKMSFFDSTPLGEIMSRFTNDMQKMDNQVAGGFIRMLSLAAALVSSVCVLLSTSILSILYLVPLIATYFVAQNYYLRTCRQMRKLENEARGPILDAAGEMSVTAAVIRAYDQAGFFQDRLNHAIDDHLKVWGPYLALDIWLRLRLQVLSSMLMLLAAALILYLQQPSSTLGLALNFVLQITQVLNVFVQARSNLDADMTSIDRILEFSSNTPEKSAKSTWDAPEGWPSSPSVEFDCFTAAYKPEDPPCLRQLSFAIKPREHIAVVGRTGAGKSSLIQALLGGIPNDCIHNGKILIGGVDIATLPLTTLRKRLSLIPQEPPIFAGTLTENLDPLDQCESADTHRVASLCKLGEGLGVTHLKDPLSHVIDPRSGTISAGQAQMIALARALLTHNNIVILDEATAAVDKNTVKALDEVMRRELGDCTVLAITHSIQTSLTYDRVIVMEHGKAVETGVPADLLKDPASAFSKLAGSTG